MTRITAVGVVCVLGILGVASAASSEPVGKKARLHVVTTKPLHVRGVGFKARERVRVVATTEHQSQTRWTVASRAGVVSAKFAIGPQACGSYRIKAFGTLGTRVSASSPLVGVEVSFPRRPQLDCMPAGVVDR